MSWMPDIPPFRRFKHFYGPDHGTQRTYVGGAFVDATKQRNAFSTFGMNLGNFLGAFESFHDTVIPSPSPAPGFRSNGKPFRSVHSRAAAWIGFAGNIFSVTGVGLAGALFTGNSPGNFRKLLNDCASITGPAFSAMALAQAIYAVGQIDKNDDLAAYQIAGLAVTGQILNGISTGAAMFNVWVQEDDGLYHIVNGGALIIGHIGALSSNLAGLLLMNKDCGANKACAFDTLSTVGFLVNIASGFPAWSLGISAGLRVFKQGLR